MYNAVSTFNVTCQQQHEGLTLSLCLCKETIFILSLSLYFLFNLTVAGINFGCLRKTSLSKDEQFA